MSRVAGLEMTLSKKRITKALIRLRGCAGWSAPVLFANRGRQVFSRRGPDSGGIGLRHFFMRRFDLVTVDAFKPASQSSF